MLHELIALVHAHIRGMWRFRWLAVGLAWLVTVAGWMFVATIPDAYRSNARIQIDTESILAPLLQGLAIQTDMRTRVAMMTRALLTRPKLEMVARQADLDLQAHTPSQMDALILRLQHNTNITSSRQSENIYTISHTSADPKTSQRVAQAFLDIFIEETLGESRSDNSTAQQFLENQTKEYEKRLIAAEQNLAEFKKQNVGRMPGEGGDYYARLQKAMSQLNKLRTALEIAGSRRDGLERQMLGEEPVFGIMAPRQQNTGNELTAALSIKIEANYTRLDELSLRFTEKHPEIQAIRETIEVLENRRGEEMEKLQQEYSYGDASAELQQNPVYQSMKIAFNEAEIEVASLQAEMNGQQKIVSELKLLVDIIPQVEANLARLNRDYSIVKQKYDALLQRLETARLSRQAEQSGENIESQVIDPPSLPTVPSSPNRQMLNSLIVMLGLAAGVALTFALHQLYPVFGDSRTVRNTIDFPILGTVSLKRSREQIIKSGLGRLAVASAALLLLVAAGGVIAFEESTRSAFQSLMRLI